MNLEFDEKTAELLRKLQFQAAARRMTLASYLEQFVETDSAADHRLRSLDEFDNALDELAADLPGVSCLPEHFSRAAIYSDHD